MPQHPSIIWRPYPEWPEFEMSNSRVVRRKAGQIIVPFFMKWDCPRVRLHAGPHVEYWFVKELYAHIWGDEITRVQGPEAVNAIIAMLKTTTPKKFWRGGKRTPQIIRAIRREFFLHGVTRVELSKKYDLPTQDISRIISRQIWKEV
jgi:hypothetical protein